MIPFGYIVNDYTVTLYLIGCIMPHLALSYTLSGMRVDGAVRFATVVWHPQTRYDKSDDLPETEYRGALK